MKYKLILAGLFISAIAFIGDLSAGAEPYGIGKYNENVPYSSSTYISISATGVNLSVNPSTGGTVANGNSTITIYSTDVVGYKLYTRAVSSTSLTQGGYQIPASANGTAAALAVNTWGYNTTGSSTNFIGITGSDILLKDTTGPFKNGDSTTVTYGLNLDRSKPAGNYASNVIYTAVPKTP